MPTYDEPTPENRAKWQAWLDRNMLKIADGTFVYADALPGASEAKKEKFARLEGRAHRTDPEYVSIGTFCEEIYKRDVINLFPSSNKRSDYTTAVDSRIIPFFENDGEVPLTFEEISSIEIGRFISWMANPRNVGSGRALKSKSIRNTITVLKDIWYFACDKYKWNLGDPFRNYNRFIPRDEIIEAVDDIDPEAPVWTYAEYQRIYKHIDPFYKNTLKFMFLTGMIASEIAGLRKKDICDDRLLVRHFISAKGEKGSYGKADKRRRVIRITAAIRECLDECLSSTDDEYLFRTKTGLHFREGTFRKNAWMPALAKAGLDYVKPYSTRHTFASWALAVDKNMNELVALMGHATKKMIYEVYGEWKAGLENEREEIRNFFGTDFLK